MEKALLALDQSSSGMVKALIRNAGFASLFVQRGRGGSRGSAVVKINKLSSEAGGSFTCMLSTLAPSRGLAMACEMLIRSSS